MHQIIKSIKSSNQCNELVKIGFAYASVRQFGLSILFIRFMALFDVVFSALHDDRFDDVAFQVDHFLLGVLALVPALLVAALPLLLFRAASKISTVITYLEHITKSSTNSDRPMNTDLS